MRFNHHTHSTLWTLFALAMFATHAAAQLPTADLTRVYPAGAAAGTEVDVAITGTDLDGVSQLRFTHPGLTAKQVMLPADDIFPTARAKAASFTLTIAADTPPGTYEVRAAGGRFGISTPRAFVVSPVGTAELSTPTAALSAENALTIAAGQVANGLATADNDHWFRLHAKAGKHLRIRCDAERIDSKLDATLVLHDANGNEIDRSRDSAGRDPIIDVHPTADTDYLISMHDFLYLGGGAHFYRLSVTGGPQIDAVFPAIVSSKAPASVIPIGPGYGENAAPIILPAFKKSSTFSAANATHYSANIVHLAAANSSQPLLAITDDPIVLEDEKNNNKAGQKINLPCTIGARFDQPDDTDSYRFSAKKGTSYQVEIVGARLDSLIDPFLVIEKITSDDKGVETYTSVRDLDDLSFGPSTDAIHRLTSRDPATTFAADADTDYRITVINQFGSGSTGPDHLYALHLREQRADFSLIGLTQRPHLEANQVFAAAPLLRRGETFPLRVVIGRHGGFAEPVTLTAKGLPAGVTAPPVTIAPNADSAVFILKASADAAAWQGDINISGMAMSGDRQLTHPVQIAATVWPISNKTTERLRTRVWTRLPLAVSDAEPAPVQLIAAEPGGKPFTVTIGEKLEIPVKLEAKGAIKGNLAVQPFGLHGYVKPAAVQIADKKSEAKVTINFAPSKDHKVAVGTYHFVLKGSGILSKYKTDPPALEAATKEQARLDALQKQRTADAAKAKTKSTAAKAAVDKATTTANAAKPEAKAAADAALADTKAKFDAAQKASTDIDAKLKLATTAKTAADATLKTATARSKERDVNFTAYSLPIRVEVKPKPEPAPEKKAGS